MINYDFKTYMEEIDNRDLSSLLNRFLVEKKMSGWYDLSIDTTDIKECANDIKNKADILIVIGIGGSYLGAKSVIEALKPYYNNQGVEIIYAGIDLSSDYLNDLINYIKGKSVYINVISKSGTTLEPSISFDYLLDYMKNNYNDYRERIIATTDEHKGTLLELANKEGLKKFIVPDDIGGRFSVLTPVGLLPIAVAGYDIDKLIDGAKECKKDLSNAFYYTNIRHSMYLNNRFIESFNVYEPKLYYFTEWLKQLFAESQGKENKGILPISTVNTRDLHSLGQYFQEGMPIIFSTTFFVHSKNNITLDKYNKTLNDINEIAMESVALAHSPHTPTSIIKIDELNEFNIGHLIFFFEVSAMLGGYLLDINYYDQPGVNAYKDIMNSKINSVN